MRQRPFVSSRSRGSNQTCTWLVPASTGPLTDDEFGPTRAFWLDVNGEDIGIMAVLFEGEEDDIQAALDHLTAGGVKVDPVEGGSLVAG